MASYLQGSVQMMFGGNRIASGAGVLCVGSLCRGTVFMSHWHWCVQCATLGPYPCLQLASLESIESFEEVI